MTSSRRLGETAIWSDLRATYGAAARATLVLPLLFLVPAVIEFGQHLVELNGGFYDGLAGARRAAEDPARLAWGFAKALAAGLPGYWFVRYLASGDPRFARRIDWPAFGLWFVIFAVGALQIWQSLFGSSPDASAADPGIPIQIAGATAQALLAIGGVYLTVLVVAWPLGRTDFGPVKSFRLVRGRFWITLAYLVLGALPMMAVHYALGYAAMAAPSSIKFPLLAIDAIAVSVLACAMAGAGLYAAERAAERHSITLLRPRVEGR